MHRIPPVNSPNANLAALLEKTAVGNERKEPLRIFSTLAHHEKLLQRFNGLGGLFMVHGELPSRMRELAILRVAWRTQCAYEWGQHVELAQRAGISSSEIQKVTGSLGSTGWETFERTLLIAVDELLDDVDLSDETWEVLAAELDEAQLLEFTLLVGFYRMTAGMLNAVRIVKEEWLPALPSPVERPVSTEA